MNERERGIAGIVSVVFAGLNALGIIITATLSLHMRQKWLAIHEDLGATLPQITQAVINMPWGVWILVTGLLLGIVVLKELISRKWIPLLLNGFFVILGIAYWAVFSAVMMAP